MLTRQLTQRSFASINHVGFNAINPNTAGYFAAGLLLSDSTRFPDSTVEACNYMIIEICSDNSLSHCEVAYIVSAKIIPCLQTITSLMGIEAYTTENFGLGYS